jgi:hypothetical protein
VRAVQSTIYAIGLALLVVVAVAGCTTTTTTTTPSARAPVDTPTKQPAKSGKAAANWNTDPCATRLHDIGGAILLYYTLNHRLPARLDELLTVPDAESDLQFVCPVSNTPYVYTPNGMLMPETRSRILLYDPAPVHNGVRWALTIVEPQEEGGPLVTKVIALPESTFRFQPASR